MTNLQLSAAKRRLSAKRLSVQRQSAKNQILAARKLTLAAKQSAQKLTLAARRKLSVQRLNAQKLNVQKQVARKKLIVQMLLVSTQNNLIIIAKKKRVYQNIDTPSFFRYLCAELLNQLSHDGVNHTVTDNHQLTIADNLSRLCTANNLIKIGGCIVRIYNAQFAISV